MDPETKGTGGNTGVSLEQRLREMFLQPSLWGGDLRGTSTGPLAGLALGLGLPEMDRALYLAILLFTLYF